VSLAKRDQEDQQQAELKKTLQTFRQILCEIRRLNVRRIAEQVNIDRETVRKISTENFDMKKFCAKMAPKQLTEEKSKEEFLGTKRITVLEQPAYSTALAPSDLFLFPKIKEILKESHFNVMITSGVTQWQL